MKWSDETVEAVAKVIYEAAESSTCEAIAQAALAAVAQSKEIRELVEAGCLLCASIGCEQAENKASKRWSKALAPFTEASDGK